MSATNVKASSVAANKSAELATGNCFFFFHQWTKWQTFEQGNILKYGGVVGYFIKQRRHCIACGHEQLRQDRAVQGDT